MLSLPVLLLSLVHLYSKVELLLDQLMSLELLGYKEELLLDQLMSLELLGYKVVSLPVLLM
ncbi:MAG: hypothetical protein EBS96_13050 [Spartobacteria bacterium]|nr:hypothetical protein [Spartobacteria bacterium]